MKALPLAISALLMLLMRLPADAQPQGSLIGGSSTTNSTTAAPILDAQIGTNSTLTLRKNVAGDCLLGFDELSGYSIAMTDELKSNTNRPAWADAQINGMIPPSIKALDGKKVVIEGFALPVSFDDKGKMTGCILMKNQISCCYGGPSQIHEFVTVRLKTPIKDPGMDDTVEVKGILHVGAERENGELAGVYRLDAEKLAK
jgi:hypothetical protein